MNASRPSRAKLLNKYSLLIAVVLGVGAIVIFPIWNFAEGPIETAEGKVVGVSMDSSDPYSLPIERVQVQLTGGALVQSVIPRHLVAHNGDLVTVAVYRRKFTGSKDYRVVKVEKQKSNL